MTVFWETMSPVSWEKQRRQMQKHGFGTPASFPFLVIDFSGFQLLLTLECWELTHAFKTNSHFLFKPASVSFCYLQPKSANEHGICCCLVTKLCLTLCDPMDCSLPGSSVHGIFQARILEWLAISFSRGSSWPRDRTHISCITGRFFITEPPGKPIDRVYDTEFLPFTQKSWLLEVWSKQNLHLYQVNIQLWIEVNILPYYSDRWLSGKHPTYQCWRCRRHKFNPWVGKIPGGGNDNPL